MRYLITGGAGFIGSHLARSLLAGGHSVVALDDFSTGRLSNIQPLLDDAGDKGRFSLIRGSVEDAQTVNLAASDCDAVFHLAAAVGVQLIADEPVRTIQSIVHGTEVVLEACNRWRRPVLVTSSSEVYGKGTRVPFSEDDDIAIGPTLHARWCYAYAKGIDEFLALAYHKQFGLDAVVVRLFNTVGPRQVGQYGMVLPRFVNAALAGGELQVTGDGRQTRCFCHVEDVVHALIALLAEPKAVGRVFNVGSDEEVAIGDLAQRVVDRIGSGSIRHVGYDQVYGQQFEDVPRRVPDLSRLRQTVGFEPKHDLSSIIDAVIDDAKAGSGSTAA
ncbi:MAG: GDP-mannose 4,6-dehydratase [Planctomycetota bacterium]